MIRGRKPKPTNLRAIDGNAGKRPLPKNEPKPKLACPDPPGDLNEIAKIQWREWAELLHRTRILTEADLMALKLACEAYGRWFEATEHIKANGMLIPTPNGFVAQSPMVQIANKAHEQIVKLLVEFGMTPSSRTRVQTVEDSPETSQWGTL